MALVPIELVHLIICQIIEFSAISFTHRTSTAYITIDAHDCEKVKGFWIGPENNTTTPNVGPADSIDGIEQWESDS